MKLAQPSCSTVKRAYRIDNRHKIVQIQVHITLSEEQVRLGSVVSVVAVEHYSGVLQTHTTKLHTRSMSGSKQATPQKTSASNSPASKSPAANKGNKVVNESAAALGTSMDIVSKAARDVVNSVDAAAKGVATSVNSAIDGLTKKTP